MRTIFVTLVGVLLAAVAAQFFLAAMGAFDTAPRAESFQPHRVLGYTLLAYALTLTLLAAVIRLPGSAVGLLGLSAGLILLQGIIASVAGALGDAGPSDMLGQLVFGFHAINALLIIGVLEAVFGKAREHARRRTPTEVVDGTQEPASRTVPGS